MSASVNFYPEMIMVQTLDYASIGLCLGSDKITKLKTNVDTNTLGKTLREHLLMTEYNLEYDRNDKKRWEKYKTVCGFKSDKETYQNARNVSCYQEGDLILLTPMENLYNKGYIPIKDTELIIYARQSDSELGEELFKARDLSTGY